MLSLYCRIANLVKLMLLSDFSFISLRRNLRHTFVQMRRKGFLEIKSDVLLHEKDL